MSLIVILWCCFQNFLKNQYKSVFANAACTLEKKASSSVLGYRAQYIPIKLNCQLCFQIFFNLLYILLTNQILVRQFEISHFEREFVDLSLKLCLEFFFLYFVSTISAYKFRMVMYYQRTESFNISQLTSKLLINY